MSDATAYVGRWDARVNLWLGNELHDCKGGAFETSSSPVGCPVARRGLRADIHCAVASLTLCPFDVRKCWHLTCPFPRSPLPCARIHLKSSIARRALYSLSLCTWGPCRTTGSSSRCRVTGTSPTYVKRCAAAWWSPYDYCATASDPQSTQALAVHHRSCSRSHRCLSLHHMSWQRRINQAQCVTHDRLSPQQIYLLLQLMMDTDGAPPVPCVCHRADPPDP